MIHNGCIVQVKDLGVSIWFGGNPSPFTGDIQGISVPGPVSVVLVHPVVVPTKEVRVENEFTLIVPSYPVKHGVESSLADTCNNIQPKLWFTV